MPERGSVEMGKNNTEQTSRLPRPDFLETFKDSKDLVAKFYGILEKNNIDPRDLAFKILMDSGYGKTNKGISLAADIGVRKLGEKIDLGNPTTKVRVLVVDLIRRYKQEYLDSLDEKKETA